MPTQNVSLSPQQVDFIRQIIDQGRFRNASEVVRAGLRMLEQEEELDKLKLEHLRRLVKDGFAAIERGEFETVTQDSLDEFLDSVSATYARSKTA